MISSREILKAIGIKSQKTLTRWHQDGLIPAPVMRTHPSGRGKIGCYPEETLQRCLEIIELKKQGHSMKSIGAIVGIPKKPKLTFLDGNASISPQSIDRIILEAEDGKNLTLTDYLQSVVMREVRRVVSDSVFRERLRELLRPSKFLEKSLSLLRKGSNPVLIFDGEVIEVTPDFMVSHRISQKTQSGGPFLAVPLYGPFQKAIEEAGGSIPFKPSRMPSEKVVEREDNSLIEYWIRLGGVNGFDLLRKERCVIGELAPRNHDESNAP